MTKWKVRTETANIGVLELCNLTFNEDYMEVSIGICDMSDNLKAEVRKAIELRKTESVKEWTEICKERPEYVMHDGTWSSKPAVIDYTYLRIVLRAARKLHTELRLVSMMLIMTIWKNV